MRFRLRTLLILLAVGPPILASSWAVGLRVLRNCLITSKPSPYDFVVVSGGGVEPALNLQLRRQIELQRNKESHPSDDAAKPLE
jgi:hypothetical protein